MIISDFGGIRLLTSGRSPIFGDHQRTNWGCYVLNLVNDSPLDRLYFSRLIAKDFVTAFGTASRVGGRRGKASASNCPEFIVGQELSGQLLLAQPSEHELGSPVYFDPRVLKRYYDEPSRFSVSFGALSNGGV